jgi:hypothetical protein
MRLIVPLEEMKRKLTLDINAVWGLRNIGLETVGEASMP